MVTEATINPALKGTFYSEDNWTIKDGQNSPDGKWYCRYAGYGTVKMTTYKGTRAMVLVPALPDNPADASQTRAASVVTRQKFRNFDMTVSMSTEKQTRGNDRGANWETAWIFFGLTDQSHHYYLYIQKDGGLELGRKDMEVWEERQIFLKTTANNSPTFQFSRYYKIRIMKVSNRIQVWVDGVQYIDYTDDGKSGNDQGKLPKPPSAEMYEGFIGPYVEDAEGYFTNWVIKPLP
jgi:hypothetical protein